MIAGLQPYPRMKESGVPWLGAVPEHWEVRRAASKLTPWKQSIRPEEVLSQLVLHYSIPNVQKYRHGAVEQGKDVGSNKLLVDRTLLLVSKLNPRMGTIALAEPHHELTTIASSEFVAMAPKHCFAHFAQYLYSSEYVRLELSARVESATKSHQRCSPADIEKLPTPWPPQSEQTAIVRFLDYVDRRIRRYVRAKQQLIKLLEEQKQAIIHRAVTRGLDPNVRLKPSGVPWLGDVPEHWEVARLGRLIELITGFPFKSDGFTQNADDIRLLRGVNVSPGRVRWDDVVKWPLSRYGDYSAFHLQAGDIVLGMDRPIIQSGTRVAIVSKSDVPALLLQRVARIRPRCELENGFLSLLLSGKSFADYLTPIFTGISVPHLSPEQIKSFSFALPPKHEQRQIVQWIGEKTKETNTAIESSEREITLLREYRTRLIADVVTGKLDVRAAAAQLPEETDEPESPEVADTFDETEEAAEAEDAAEPEEMEA